MMEKTPNLKFLTMWEYHYIKSCLQKVAFQIVFFLIVIKKDKNTVPST